MTIKIGISLILATMQVSLILAVGIGFLLSMIFTSGEANINHYNEGWIETIAFLGVGIYGTINIIKNPN